MVNVAKVEETGPVNRKYKVLVVDDERNIVRQIRLRFENEGFDVLEAHNGQEALQLCAGGEPDVVITDVRMPLMGGYEFLKNLNRTGSSEEDLPIVICMSGYMDLALDKALGSGASAFFAKPVDPGDLVATSRNFLRKKELYQAVKLEGHKYKSLAEDRQLAIDQIGMVFMHELKNHVTGLIASLQRLLMPSYAMKMLGDPKVRQIVENASRKGWELDEIIKTVYSIYSTEGESLAAFSAKDLITTAFSFSKDYLDDNGIKLEISPIIENFMVFCSGGAVLQILYNLIKNSAEAMTSSSVKKIFISVHKDEKFGYFNVRDTGPGILEELSNKILEARFTTKSEGLGLGMAFCVKAAAGFGGSIRVGASNPGGNITVEIPLAAPHTRNAS